MRGRLLASLLAGCSLLSAPAYAGEFRTEAKTESKTLDSFVELDEPTSNIGMSTYDLSLLHKKTPSFEPSYFLDPPRRFPRIEIINDYNKTNSDAGPMPVEINVNNRPRKPIIHAELPPRKQYLGDFEVYEDSWSVPILHTTAFLLGMRVVEAMMWEDYRESDWGIIKQRYKKAYTKAPYLDFSEDFYEYDHDRWQINLIGHTLMGSEMYMRSRICKRNVIESLAIAAVGSAVWEYVFEVGGSHPSGLDLIHTPLMGGLVFGEGRFQLWRAIRRIRNRNLRNTMSVVVDPLGEFERYFFKSKC